MISDNLPPRQPLANGSAHKTIEGSYIDWAAILAGGIFALAISFLLISFGASLGLSLTSPYRGDGVSAVWLAIAAGLWFAWVMVTGFGAGGYLAGRMRRRVGDATATEVEVRDGAHRLMVWATGAVLSMVLAAAGAGGLLSAGSSAVETVAEVTAEAASSDYFANVMLRNAAGEPQEDATAPLQPATGVTTTRIVDVDPAIQGQIASIIARSAMSGEMIERDRDYLARVVAANTDLDQTEARARVDEVNAEIDNARAEALAAVEKARVAGVIFGFIAAATLLLGAVAAFFAAAAGGRHRDEGLGLDVLTMRR